MTKIIVLGGDRGGIGNILSDILLIGGLGAAAYLAYKYFIEGAEAQPECTEDELECINGYEYKCVDGKLVATGVTCVPATCVDGATKCDTTTLTKWECSDGQWLDTGVPCEVNPTLINSVAFPFWHEGTTKPVIGMLCKFTNRESGAQWTGVTDSGGVVRFHGIPIGTYTLAVTLDQFHIEDYDRHQPFADWRYIDLSGMAYYIGKDWTQPTPIFMLKNVPDPAYTRFKWLSDGGTVAGDAVYLMGATGLCKCSSGVAGCNHPWTSLYAEVRNRWNELIDAYVFMQRTEDDDVCFTDGMPIPEEETLCEYPRQVAKHSIYEKTIGGKIRKWVWANNNNTMSQRITMGPTWDDPVTGETMVFGVEMVFTFNKCSLSYYTCFEKDATLDNSQCP